VWSLPLLLLVLPFLVGHGLGCVSDCPPDEYGYELGGASYSESDRDIRHVGRLKLLQGEQVLAQTTSFGISSPPLTFYVEDDPLNSIRLTVDAEDEVGQLGRLWLNSTKLLHTVDNEQTGLFVDLVFSLSEMPADSALNSTIASSVDYVLSSSHEGHNYLTLGRKAKLSLNDSTVLLNSYDGTAVDFAPRYFSASTGDKLTLEIEFDGSTTETTSLWLHKPDGTGTKLLHRLKPQQDKLVRVSWTLP
jgi:hypothetical protein